MPHLQTVKAPLFLILLRHFFNSILGLEIDIEILNVELVAKSFDDEYFFDEVTIVWGGLIGKLMKGRQEEVVLISIS